METIYQIISIALSILVLIGLIILFDTVTSMKVYAWIRGYSWIVLRDAEKNEWETYLRYNEEGFYFANVYPFSKIGYVLILPNGEVNSSSGSCYIKSWDFIVNRGDFK